MGGWDKQLEDSTEFMTINGIFKATGEPPEDVKAAFPNMGSFQWYDAERNADTGKMEYKGIEESAKFVDEIVQREGIDGLLGFSQGATLIGEMLKRCSPSFERPGDDATTTTTEGEEEAMRMKSLRFAVLISGMPSRADEKLSEQMMRSSKNSNSSNSSGGGKIIGASIPTLHVVGQQDRAIPPTLTKLMHKEFGEKAVLVEHEKGHVIPKVYPSNELGEKVKKFFDERLMEKNSNARL
jgi:predicted esterase